MLGVAERLVLEYGQFVEQVSELEAFVGLDAINTLFKPVDVECPDSRRVIARRWVCPGMGPDIDGPTPAFVVPSMVDVLFRGHGEDGEELFLGVAQVNPVHLCAHELTPQAQASQGDPARLHLGPPPGQPLAPLPRGLSQSGPRQLAHRRSPQAAQARLSMWRRLDLCLSLASSQSAHRSKRLHRRRPLAPLASTLRQPVATQPEPAQQDSGRAGRGYPHTPERSLPGRPATSQALLPALSSSVVLDQRAHSNRKV